MGHRYRPRRSRFGFTFPVDHWPQAIAPTPRAVFASWTWCFMEVREAPALSPFCVHGRHVHLHACVTDTQAPRQKLPPRSILLLLPPSLAGSQNLHRQQIVKGMTSRLMSSPTLLGTCLSTSSPAVSEAFSFKVIKLLVGISQDH